jgi:hypothetical protein
MINNINRSGNRIHRDDVLARLGLDPNKPLPAAGTLSVMLDNGVLAWVRPADDKTYLGGTAKHRLVCSCRECGKIVSFGCYDQHYAVHYRSKAGSVLSSRKRVPGRRAR